LPASCFLQPLGMFSCIVLHRGKNHRTQVAYEHPHCIPTGLDPCFHPTQKKKKAEKLKKQKEDERAVSAGLEPPPRKQQRVSSNA